jgi:chromosomal replication initiator protein
MLDVSRIWTEASGTLKASLGDTVFETWITPLKPKSQSGLQFVIEAPDGFFKEWVERHYRQVIQESVRKATGEMTELLVEALAKSTAGGQKPALDMGRLRAVEARDNLLLNPRYTFDNFVLGPSNRHAHAYSAAVADSPGKTYNPLFIYGGVGVGKTHLMHAVANAILARKPQTRVVYCMGEEFLNEIVEAIQTKTARLFKQKYRTAQLLLVDDVQFIAGKQTAQEEFFHTFNTVHREGGQIILISDRSPSEISKLEDRLRSRFEGGLTVDIGPPDFELRIAIINIKSAALGISVPQEAARLIAANLSDIRAIEGFLRRLTTETAMRGETITADLVSSLLSIKPGEGEEKKPARRVSPQELLEAVALYFGIKTTAIKSAKRDRPLARPRQIYMYLCRTEIGLTLDDIGGTLGGRDHTTVMHGVETITREMSTNERLRSSVEGIKQKVWA